MKIYLTNIHRKEVSENDICKEILLELVDNVGEQRYGIKRKCDENDVQNKSEMKTKCHEAVEIYDEALRKIMIKQTYEYKHKFALGESVYKILGELERCIREDDI